jgi:hypothetical protein
MKPFRRSRDYEGKFALTTLQNPFLDVTPRPQPKFTETKRTEAPAERCIDIKVTAAPPETPNPTPAAPLPEPTEALQIETIAAEPAKIPIELGATPETETVNAAPPADPPQPPAEPPSTEEARAESQRPVTPASFLPEPDLSELERHSRKCAICNHPFRQALEEDFINWAEVSRITKIFELNDSRAVYRHAHATGLFERRRQNVRFAAERIVEHVNNISKPAPETVLNAIRTITRLNERGEWHEPTSHVVVSSGRQMNPPDHQNSISIDGPDSNRQFSEKLARLETPSK